MATKGPVYTRSWLRQTCLRRGHMFSSSAACPTTLAVTGTWWDDVSKQTTTGRELDRATTWRDVFSCRSCVTILTFHNLTIHLRRFHQNQSKNIFIPRHLKKPRAGPASTVFWPLAASANSSWKMFRLGWKRNAATRAASSGLTFPGICAQTIRKKTTVRTKRSNFEALTMLDFYVIFVNPNTFLCINVNVYFDSNALSPKSKQSFWISKGNAKEKSGNKKVFSPKKRFYKMFSAPLLDLAHSSCILKTKACSLS